jgi:hypothetical protein
MAISMFHHRVKRNTALRRIFRTLSASGVMFMFFMATGQPSLSVSPVRVELVQPGVRNAHAMVYDSVRKRVVLFGGADASTVRGDTWEWDGRRWRLVSLTGPAPRTFPAMTYDSVRRRLILYGGNRVLFGRNRNDNEYLSDTWEWDGRKWSQIDTPGPPARAEAVLIFDVSRRRSVLFGGHTMTENGRKWLGDTWEWDGTRWQAVDVNGPSPRNGAAAVYDRARERMVLFGGSTQQGISGETWEFDGRAWTRIDSATVEGRFNCVIAYDEVRRKVIRFGGRFGGEAVGDTWEYDSHRWRLLTNKGPRPRNHAAMVYDQRYHRIILFGGHDLTNVFGDMWQWDGAWLLRGPINEEKRVDNGH